MRYELRIRLKESFIEIEYRKAVMSYFKWALSDYECGKYYADFYGSSKSKDLTFGVFLKKPKFKKSIIELESKEISIIVSSSSKKLGLALFNSILSKKGMEFKLASDNSMTLHSINLKKEKNISEGSVVFKILSPLCLREHVRDGNRDQYHSIASEDFLIKLKDCIKFQLEPKFEIETSEIQIVPLNCKKTVIQHNGLFIESTLGTIAISANKDILNELYMNGFGSRKSSGFGLLEVVN